MAVAASNVFQYADRWQGALRGLFADKPDTDALLSVAEQRDQQLERFLGKLWNPHWIPWTATYSNVTGGAGIFEYQLLNASLIMVQGWLSAGTATAAGPITVSLPYKAYFGTQAVGAMYGPLSVVYNTGFAGAFKGTGQVNNSAASVVISPDGAISWTGGDALTGLGFSGVYRYA